MANRINKKPAMKLHASTRLVATEVCASCGEQHEQQHASTCTAARSQEWFTKLEESAKADYVKRFPGSRFLRHPHVNAKQGREMNLQASARLKATAAVKVMAKGVNLKKLDFSAAPPDDFVDAFSAEFSGAEARDKLWVYRKAAKSILDTPQYKQWMSAFNDAAAAVGV